MFWVLSALALGGSGASWPSTPCTLQRMFLMTMIIPGGVLRGQDALFLGVVQVVHTGAVMMLFLVVLMLTWCGPGITERGG